MLNRPMISSLLLAALAVMSATHLEALALKLDLQLEQREYLPAYPIFGLLRLTNTSEVSVDVPAGATILRVHPEGRSPFIAQNPYLGGPMVLDLPEGYLPQRLLRGESFEFQVSLGPTLGAAFLADARLWEPGRYSIELAFLDGPATESELLDFDATSRLPRTNDVALTIVKPTGDDAVVWQRLVDMLTRGDPVTNSAAARKIWKAAPPSKYLPYVALLIVPREDEFVELWSRVGAMDSEGHLRNEMVRRLAVFHFRRAQGEIDREFPDLAGAIRRREAARAILQDLAKNGRARLAGFEASRFLELMEREHGRVQEVPLP